MRRAVQSLAPRLLQSTSQGFAPLAVTPAHLPWLNERESQSAACSACLPAICRGPCQSMSHPIRSAIRSAEICFLCMTAIRRSDAHLKVQ